MNNQFINYKIRTYRYNFKDAVLRAEPSKQVIIKNYFVIYKIPILNRSG